MQNSKYDEKDTNVYVYINVHEVSLKVLLTIQLRQSHSQGIFLPSQSPATASLAPGDGKRTEPGNETVGAIHSTKIPTGPTGKRGPPQKVDPFFETFPVGPNRSIEFWTEIFGKFGWMDRAL